MKMRKVTLTAVVGILTLAVSQAAFAGHHRYSGSTAPADFWQNVRTLLKKCVVQVVEVDGQGHRTAQPLKSICDEVQVFDNHGELVLGGQRYFAYLQDSTDSDGGDLNDVTVEDSTNAVVARKKGVLAYGDVLLALLGGSTDGIITQEVRK